MPLSKLLSRNSRKRRDNLCARISVTDKLNEATSYQRNNVRGTCNTEKDTDLLEQIDSGNGSKTKKATKTFSIFDTEDFQGMKPKAVE